MAEIAPSMQVITAIRTAALLFEPFGLFISGTIMRARAAPTPPGAPSGYSCRAESPSRKPPRDAMKPSVLLSRLFVFSFSAVSMIASAQTLPLNPEPRVATATIQPASDDAQLALKRFTLPAGMQAKLWAAEPMLANPVAF